MTTRKPVLVVALVVLAIGVAVAVFAFLLLQSPWGEARLARLVEAQAERALDGDVSIARVHGNLLRDATLEGLTIAREGQPLVSAERVQMRYDAIGLVRGRLAIQEITLVRPVVHLVRGADGITLFELLEKDPDQADTPPRPYSIDLLRVVDGQVVIGRDVVRGDAVRVPRTLNDLDAELTVSRDAGETSLGVAHLSFVGEEPAIVLEQLNGAMRLSDEDVVFQEVAVRTRGSVLSLDGSLRNFTAGGETK
jgi:uncharacterized protein involved in outer membrane biogenesis